MSFRNTSVSLSEHFVDFANEQVSSGRYGSISEVVRAGLRLLEEHENQLRTLKEALADGMASGISSDFDFDALIDGNLQDLIDEGDASGVAEDFNHTAYLQDLTLKPKRNTA
jgi:antitoxin ParD1/3/4